MFRFTIVTLFAAIAFAADTPKQAPICPNASKASASSEDKECHALLKLQLLETKQQAIISQANTALKPIAEEILGILTPLCKAAGIEVDRCQPNFQTGTIEQTPKPEDPPKK